jgi:5,10-methylenetetrahydromethanopterin reductase
LQLGVSFGGYYTTVEKYVESARYAEKENIDSLWLPDSQLIHRDVYICLSLCARETRRIRLATGVTNPVTRDVSVTASAISTLNEISAGRMILGIGSGDSSVRRMGLSPEKISYFESYVSALRKLCYGDSIKLANGEKASLRWSSAKIPIFISATGPRILELAGRIGDGVIINVGCAEKSLKDAIEAINRGQNLGGNQKSQFSVADFSFINISEDRRSAIDAARPYVIWYLKNSPKLFERNGISTRDLESCLDRSGGGFVERDFIHSHDDYSENDYRSFVTDEMVSAFAIAGTPEDCVRKIREKERSGVNLFIARHSGDEEGWKGFLTLFCESVLPNFR